jgi:hypothetical protein
MNVSDPTAALLLLFAFPVAVVAVIRWVLPGDDDLPVVIGVDPGWPRGVQEEEPVRYRIELIGRARRSEQPLAPQPPGATYLARPTAAD